jgi:hypothetical protein
MATHLLPRSLLESVNIQEEENGKKYTVTLNFKDQASGIIRKIPGWNIDDTEILTTKTITLTVLPESKEIIFEKNNLSASIKKDKIKGLGKMQYFLPNTISLYLSKISVATDGYLSIEGTLDYRMPISKSIPMSLENLPEVSSRLEWKK